ncbi:MAG: amidohydrolase [Desulfobacterales bacterium]|nr:MAG: amidohydrolase [Desulfobacterales bacterium]
MIVDFHTHLFPKAIRENREAYFLAEPAFRHLYESTKSKLVGAKELLNAMDENQVDKSVVFGFPWINSDIIKKHNDYIIEVVEKYSDRLIGLGCLNPASRDAAAEALRCLDAKLCGIGELAFYQSGFDKTALDQLAPIMNMCHERDLPVLIHTNEPVGHTYPGKTPITLNQIYQLIKKFPENKIVLAHWGGGLFFFNLIKREVKESLKNVFFDTAASPFLYDPEIYSVAIKLIGLEKILFGSDYPLLPPKRYFKEMAETGLSDNQITNICGLNAARLLGV